MGPHANYDTKNDGTHAVCRALAECADNQKREKTFPGLDDQGRVSRIFRICIDFVPIQ